MAAKVRLSEHNTKQKTTFLFLLSSESTFDEVADNKKPQTSRLRHQLFLSNFLLFT